MYQYRRILLLVFAAVYSSVLAACVNTAFGPEVLVTRQPIDPVYGAPLPANRSVAVALSNPPAANVAGELAQGAVTGETRVPNETRQPAAAEAASPVGQELGDESAATLTPAAEAPLPDPNLKPLQQTHNILLIGTDQADLDYVGRTDTIMILALDLPSGRAALISLPRDIYLPIPGVGYSRINTAYAFGEGRKPGGGIPLLESTIEKNFGIPIHNYVRIDFSGFKNIVDAVGGVDITVDCPLYDDLFWRFFGVGTLEAGTYHMTGEQALYYARSRKTTSDFDRARRQQQVLLAIRKRALDADLIPRIPALWLALRDIIDTDLDIGQIIDLAKLGATIQSSHLHGLVLRPPLVNGYVTPQGAMVQLPDLPAIAQALDVIWERKPIGETNTEERFCPNGGG
jgi:LCP family protein required for cell wall assembly